MAESYSGCALGHTPVNMSRLGMAESGNGLVQSQSTQPPALVDSLDSIGDQEPSARPARPGWW